MASARPPAGSPEYFRARAAEARELAEKSRNLSARDSWTDIAKHWEEMAEKAKQFDQGRR